MKDYFEGHEEKIAGLIKQGFTEGYEPRWILQAESQLLEDESSIENIAEQVKQGFIEGYHPRWQLVVD